ncbi:MAG: hypothetical protein HUU29_00535 [Planctomycetaceae bacterium]|nr:hypothetical protein [Planctomycetaceae bacterium]
MSEDPALSQPPVILLQNREGGSIFWRAAISLSNKTLTKTAKLNIKSGTVSGSDAEKNATDLAYKAICDMCAEKGVPPPKFKYCIVQKG